MELFSTELSQFAEKYTSPEDALLKEIADFTTANHAQPHMLSGHVQGLLLSMISYMLQPRRVLEIGTFTGYSTLCLAKGLAADGVLHTLELRQETADIAHNFFKKSTLYAQIKLHVGDAKEIIPTLGADWDLVFIDADKKGYIDYFDMVLPSVKKNGFILVDNIFFHGESFKDEPKGKSGKAVQAFNNYVLQRGDIEKLVLTIRDGLYLIRKI
ncbi:MAG: O-methyltransferase [Niabella sp.]